MDQQFQCELVEEKATDPMVSFYTTGKFIDFCRGPHIPSTGRIKAFKLMSVAGAYWKGQEGNPQMQRIYGACFFTQKELDEYLHSWKRPSGAITAGSARSSIFSAFRTKPGRG